MTTIRQTHFYGGGQVWRASQLNDGATALLDDLAGRNGLRGREASLEVLNGPDGDRYVRLPQGTTAQRPASPELGYIRFNTTRDSVEFWNGSAWRDLSHGTGVVTFANLNDNGGVGTTEGTVSEGNHTH